MDWFIFVPVLIWLGILSWYDIKTREIPHAAWVIIPLILAGIYRVWLGGWQLVLFASIVLAASERGWIAGKMIYGKIAGVNWWLPLVVVGVWIAASNSPIGAMAILGFWIAWELQWWGGADAVVSIILFIIWPDLKLIGVFTIIHFMFFCISSTKSMLMRQYNPKRIPGIPIILAICTVFFLL